MREAVHRRRLGGGRLTAAFVAAFVAGVEAGVEALRTGDPRDRDTRIGPLARDDLRATIQRQAEKSVAVGARLLTGGKPLPGDGYFYQPTVLTDTGPGMPAFDEETFGPLAAIAVAQDDEDAVRLANATAYGLGLSVWTADPGRGVALARRVTSGAAFVNAIVASDPRLPTGSPPDRITPLPQPIPGPVCIHPGRQVLALPARTLHLAGPVGSLGEERR